MKPFERKLTDAQVLKMMAMRSRGVDLEDVAEIFGVSPVYVSQVERGRNDRFRVALRHLDLRVRQLRRFSLQSRVAS